MRRSKDDMKKQDQEQHEENRLDGLGAMALRQQNCHLDNGQRVRTDDHDRAISQLHQIAKEILRPRHPLFSIEHDLRRGSWVRRSPLGARLLGVFRTDFDRIQMDYPLHKFSPVMMIFMKFRHLLPFNPASYFDLLMPRLAAEQIYEVAVRVLRLLQRMLQRPSLRRLTNNFRRKAIDNFNGLIDSIDTLSQRRVSVTALRFDLYYRRAGSRPVKFGDQPDVQILDELMSLRERFHRSLDRRFGGELLGYAWVLEFGRERGFHFHYLVFLKHGVPGDDIDLVELLEAKWKELTSGRGELDNVNARRRGFRYPAVGRIRLDDPQVVKGLQFLVSYMTLAPLFVKLEIQERYDTFAKGRFSVSTNKSGRPKLRPSRSRLKISVAEAVTSRLTFI